MADEGTFDSGSSTPVQVTLDMSPEEAGRKAYLGTPVIRGDLIGGKIYGDGVAEDFSHITGIDPTHTYSVHEFQRRAYLTPTNEGVVSRLIHTIDNNTHEHGYLYTDPETGSATYFTDVRKAFQAIGILTEKNWNTGEIERFIHQLPDARSDARQLFQEVFADNYHVIPFEVSFSLYSLSKKMNPEQIQDLKDTVIVQGMNAMKITSLLDTPEQLDTLFHTMDKYDLNVYSCMSGMLSVYGDIDNFAFTNMREDVDVKLVQRVLFDQLRSLMRVSLESADDIHFSWKYPIDTLNAMREIMFEFSGLDYPNVIQMLEMVEFGQMEQSYLQHPTIQKALEAYLNIRSIVKFYEDKPGEMVAQSHEFYTKVGHKLYENRSESTGDKTMQLMLTKTAIELLVSKRILPPSFSMLDAGSGPMDFLRALYASLDETYIPGSVLAVDRESFVVPDALQGRVTFEKADLTNAEYLHAHADQFDLSLHIWSPLNDNGEAEQMEFLDSINHKLHMNGIALIEIPIDYEKEMTEHMKKTGRKTRGRIHKEFEGDDGIVDKDFEITNLMPMFRNLKESGFKVLNYGKDASIAVPLEYTTASGQKRVFLIVQKVGEPAESVGQEFLHAHQARVGSYDARQSTGDVRQ